MHDETPAFTRGFARGMTLAPGSPGAHAYDAARRRFTEAADDYTSHDYLAGGIHGDTARFGAVSVIIQGWDPDDPSGECITFDSPNLEDESICVGFYDDEGGVLDQSADDDGWDVRVCDNTPEGWALALGWCIVAAWTHPQEGDAPATNDDAVEAVHRIVGPATAAQIGETLGFEDAARSGN